MRKVHRRIPTSFTLNSHMRAEEKSHCQEDKSLVKELVPPVKLSDVGYLLSSSIRVTEAAFALLSLVSQVQCLALPSEIRYY